jgi:uncharacterized protein YjbI with pentapeptide repeats
MTNQHNITLLQQGYKIWNSWRQKNSQTIPEFRGVDFRKLHLFKVDLSGVDLSELDFSGTSLLQANLSGANLYKADLSNAILQEADFSGANLIEANLKNKKLPQTNFSGANLSGANLSGVKLSRTNLSEANLSGTNLSGAEFHVSTIINNTNFRLSNLRGSDLRGLDLSFNNFSGANLAGANLAGANLTGVNLAGANLTGANLQYTNLRQIQIQETIIDEKWKLIWDIINNVSEGRDLHGLDLSMADLEGANLSEADLRNVNFTGAKLNRANFTNSNLVQANLSESDINMAILKMANLRFASLCESDLSGADLSEADLGEANLKHAKLHRTKIQKAIIDPKWYLVWDVVNNGAEGRDLSGGDLSEADLSGANFKNANLSGSNFSRSILEGSDFSLTNLSGANFNKANLLGVNFDLSDLSEADFSEVEGFSYSTCSGASSDQTSISSRSPDRFQLQGANFNEVDFSGEDIDGAAVSKGAAFSVIDKKDFFEHLFSWKTDVSFNESIRKSLSLSKKGFIPGILLYTDEDDNLSLYIRQHYDAFDKLTGDWCTIYLLENPSPKWKKANKTWRKRAESGLNISWFRSKPYDKSEAYDIARQLNVEVSSLPCLVLISPTNLSEKLVLQIREVSPDYFRKLFSTLEKLVISSISKSLKEKDAGSQVFNYLKLNFHEIVDFLEKNASKQDGNSNTKYILKGDNIFVSIEPVNIGNLNYTEKVEGDYIQGDFTDQSRNFTVGDIGGDFKPIGSALMADGVKSSGTVVAESLSINKDLFEQGETSQKETSLDPISKPYEHKSIGKAKRIILIFVTFLSGLTIYIIFSHLSSSKDSVPRIFQEKKVKD